MSSFPIILIIALFAALLFFNVYFRVKVFKHYKYLVQNRVDFSLKHLLDDKKMAAEILSKHPGHKEHILAFANNIRNSVYIAGALIVLISLLAYVIR